MAHSSRRNPVAKAVRTTPLFHQRIVPDIKKYRRVPNHKWRNEA